MSNHVEIEFTDTYEDLARKINMIEPVARLERDTVGPEPFVVTSEIEIHSYVRIGWTQRVLNWFRNY